MALYLRTEEYTREENGMTNTALTEVYQDDDGRGEYVRIRLDIFEHMMTTLGWEKQVSDAPAD